MRYAGIIENDVVNGQGVCVSFWCQGCPHHCNGCHNAHTWDFSGGKEISVNGAITKISTAITKNGIRRNFSILGGEPLCDENVQQVIEITNKIRERFPWIKVFVWTGYTYEELLDRGIPVEIFDYIIDGRFKLAERSLTIALRGSYNQRVIDVRRTLQEGKIVLWTEPEEVIA